MKILIISDLHLGIKNDVSNNFKLNEHHFNNYLLNAIGKYDIIVMNGDVFELWEDMIQTDGSTLEAKIRNRVNSILNSWIFGNLIRSHPKIIIISGNHDLYIKKYNVLPKRISDKLIISSNGYNILITHGHKGDIFCDDNSCCAGITCCCSQVKSTLENLLDENLDDEVSKIVASLDTSDKKITKYALQLLDISNFNVIVFGHTHTRRMIRTKNGVYVNEGCIVDKHDNIDQCIININRNELTIDNLNVGIDNNLINNFDRCLFLNGKLQPY